MFSSRFFPRSFLELVTTHGPRCTRAGARTIAIFRRPTNNFLHKRVCVYLPTLAGPNSRAFEPIERKTWAYYARLVPPSCLQSTVCVILLLHCTVMILCVYDGNAWQVQQHDVILVRRTAKRNKRKNKPFTRHVNRITT